MKLQIYSSNFEKSDFLFDHIGGHLAENLHTGIEDEVVAVRVWLKIENSFLKRGKDSYLCEVEMQTKNLGVIFSKEKSKDCYESAKIAIHEVVQILSKKVEARMKRERKLRGLSKKAFA